MTYFLDAKVIIDLLNGNKRVLENFKSAYVNAEIKIPDIAYYEVLRGFCWKDSKNQLSNFEIFVQKCGIVNMDLQTLRIAANIYANLMRGGNKVDDDGDIFIGASAVRHNAVLVTNNIRHLSRISAIQLENWRL